MDKMILTDDQLDDVVGGTGEDIEGECPNSLSPNKEHKWEETNIRIGNEVVCKCLYCPATKKVYVLPFK